MRVVLMFFMVCGLVAPRHHWGSRSPSLLKTLGQPTAARPALPALTRHARDGGSHGAHGGRRRGRGGRGGGRGAGRVEQRRPAAEFRQEEEERRGRQSGGTGLALGVLNNPPREDGSYNFK